MDATTATARVAVTDAAAALPPSMRVLERGWVSSNNILLFDDDHSATLIDSGYVAHAEQTIQLVRQALGGRTLARVINTHLHSDHCGGNAAVKQEFDALIFIPPSLAAAVEHWDEATLGYPAFGQACDRFIYDSLITPGDLLTMGGQQWQPLTSPGHDPNSIVLWNAQDRILISADALWEHGFGAIFPEVEGESGFTEQRAILQQIKELKPRLIIPGHGAPFTGIAQALTRAFGRLDALEASPERNARNVIRTLIKFHLLIVRQTTIDGLIAHFSGARYAQVVNQRYFQLGFADFILRTVHELAAAGALELREAMIVNCD